ncbi:hypothetical protein Tco_0054124 [Tanacetum coccineum]
MNGSPSINENRFRRGTIDKTLFIKKDKDDAQEILDEFYGGARFLLRVVVKTTNTLIETNKALLKDEEAEDVDVYLYRLMIGSLMYLTAPRPDIMFAVCACARFQVTLKVSYLYAVKRIFRYLKGQPKLGLWYPRDSPFDLEAFSDSDYAGASLDRKSTTGAEYVAAANCCGQAKHIEYMSQTPRQAIRGQDTKISQSGGPPKKVGDEAVHKELGDKIEKAATTASTLEAEQDSGVWASHFEYVVLDNEYSICSHLVIMEGNGVMHVMQCQ